MKLFAALSWYDEPISWLAATVASLSRIGVDHLVAVDGAYIHFDGDACSGLEQSDAVLRAADSVGIACTLVRPNERLWTETQKRQHCFDLIHMYADEFADWCIIIDADEVITSGSREIRSELAALDEDFTSAAVAWTQRIDPASSIGVHNTEQTPRIYQRLDVPTENTGLQTRFIRIMPDLAVRTTHYNFVGRDRQGVLTNLRPDIDNSQMGDLPHGRVASRDHLEHIPTLDHRDPWRTAERRRRKTSYYQTRDELGIERA